MIRTHHLATMAFAAALLATPTLVQAANPFSFHITLDLGFLSRDTQNGPFGLDFQLGPTDGIELSNTARISDFVFLGSGAGQSGAANTTNASGDLGSTINLSNALGASEFYQYFTAGTTGLEFNVTLSQNASGLTPQEFDVSLFNSTDGNNQNVVQVNITDRNTVADVRTLKTVQPVSDNNPATITPVPEPGSFGALVAGLGVLMTWRWRRPRLA